MNVIAHRLLIVLAMVPLLAAFASVGIFMLLAVAADRVLPDARWGNCWTYAAAQWARFGGYVSMRRSQGILVANCVPVPHAIWQERPGDEIRMTSPLNRREGYFLPIHALLFDFEVLHWDIHQPGLDHE